MSEKDRSENKLVQYEEKLIKGASGMAMLALIILIALAAVGLFILTAATGKAYFIIAAVLLVLLDCFLPLGLKILKPNEAYVLTLFGKYHGTLKGEGFFFVNPFATPTHPADNSIRVSGAQAAEAAPAATAKNALGQPQYRPASRKLSMKTMTLSNDKQKINDQLGNPIIIGIVVIWRVVNTAKAIFNVDNYKEFLSIQCDSALRNIARLYPYDVSADGDEKSLRGSSQEVAEMLKQEIQSRVDIAGLEVIEARITHLSYAPEIASAMLQRQQATAIIEARQIIVDGAVGMVEMALNKISNSGIVDLDEERKAAMVSNLLVVLCGNKEAQPIVNSGSIY